MSAPDAFVPGYYERRVKAPVQAERYENPDLIGKFIKVREGHDYIILDEYEFHRQYKAAEVGEPEA